MWTFQGNILSPLAFWEFSWPAGLGRNSTTSQEVFVELYSVGHGVKEKGICVYFPKWNCGIGHAFESQISFRSCAMPPKGLCRTPPSQRGESFDQMTSLQLCPGLMSGLAIWEGPGGQVCELLPWTPHCCSHEVSSLAWRFSVITADPSLARLWLKESAGQPPEPFPLVGPAPGSTKGKSKHRCVWWCGETCLQWTFLVASSQQDFP